MTDKEVLERAKAIEQREAREKYLPQVVAKNEDGSRKTKLGIGVITPSGAIDFWLHHKMTAAANERISKFILEEVQAQIDLDVADAKRGEDGLLF